MTRPAPDLTRPPDVPSDRTLLLGLVSLVCGLALGQAWAGHWLSPRLLPALALLAATYAAAGALYLALFHRRAWVALGAGHQVARILVFAVTAGASIGTAQAWIRLHTTALHELGPDVLVAVAVAGGHHATLLLASWMGVHALLRSGARRARLEVERAELSERAARAQLDALAGQVGPHFLFNALNVVKALVDVDADAARSVVVSLARLLRRTIDSGGGASWPLSEELDTVRAYLAIEATRFGPRLNTRFDVPAPLHELGVPRLLLLTLVENAVTHGIARRAAGGTVTISAEADPRGPGCWLLHVENEAPGETRVITFGTGLTNAAARVALVGGAVAGLDLAYTRDGRVRATVRLPRTPAPSARGLGSEPVTAAERG